MVDGTRLCYVDPSLIRNGSIHLIRVLNEDARVYVCTVSTTYNGLPAPTISTLPTQIMVIGMYAYYTFIYCIGIIPFLHPSILFTAQPIPPTITEASSLSPTSVRVIWSIIGNLNHIQHFMIITNVLWITKYAHDLLSICLF